MIKLILKYNRLYDNMNEPKRTLFFFFVLVPIIFGSQMVLSSIFDAWGYIIWSIFIMIVVAFRMTPVFVDIKKMHSENENENSELK